MTALFWRIWTYLQFVLKDAFLRRIEVHQRNFFVFSFPSGDTIGFLQFPCKPFLPASRFVTLKSFGPVLTKFGYNPVAKRYRRFVLTLLVSNSFVLISNLKDKGYVTTKKSLLIEKQTVWGKFLVTKSCV